MKLIDKVKYIESLQIDDLSAKGLLLEILDTNMTQLHSRMHDILTHDENMLIDRCLQGVMNGMPTSRITGKRYFWNNVFKVSEYTLDPRPETEKIVELAVNSGKVPATILDIGTGTGCILLSLLGEFCNASGVGADISGGALSTASENAVALGIDRATWVKSDWYSAISDKFDLIVSNPPYVKTECADECLHDPPIALWDRGCYENIVTTSHLNAGGVMILEVPEYSLDMVKSLGIARGFKTFAAHESGVAVYGVVLCA